MNVSGREIGVNVSTDMQLVLFWQDKHLKIQLTEKECRELAERLLAVVRAKSAARN